MIKKRHVLHLAMGVVMTSLLGSCAADEIVGGAGSGNGVLSFGVEVNAGASEVKPMGGATRSAEKTDSDAVMSSDIEGFFPTSSVELSSVDGNAIYANCDERRGINMHNNVDYKATRGSIQTQDHFYESFALYGYVYDSGKTWANDGGSISVDTKISGIEMKKGTGDEYTANTNPKVYWPGGSKKATFFAVAPYGSTAAAVSAVSGGPKITYTVPQLVESQEDLLVAKSDENIKCDGKTPTSLTFNHALAAIQFVKGNLGEFTDITKVEIIGVNNKGTLSSFSIPLSWTKQSIDVSTNTYSITSLSDVMFLMPQTIPNGAKLKVTFKNNASEEIFEADLNGTIWEAGHRYTYSLSVNEVTGSFIFEVISPAEPVAVGGGEATFNVKSYFQYQNEDKSVPIPWSCSCNVDGEMKTINGVGSVEGEEKSITIGPNTYTHTEVLKNNPAKGTKAEPFNLAAPTGTGSDQNTANCYVVSAPGVYKLPLVYGNGIKNGTTNNSCYDTSANYMNHEGTQINSLMPYIYGHGYNPEVGSNGAKIVWTSSENLITNAQISSDEHYLVFTVNQSAIQQGNAVVAAVNNNTIVWSWHIWVTDTPLTTYTYGSYNFLNMPLGFVDSSTIPRNINVSFSQSNGSTTKSITISQAGDAATSGTALFYQWGRKDPFRTPVNSVEPGGVAQSTAIQKPWVFYKGSDDDWSSPKNNNGFDYWNVGITSANTSTTVTKSIYDPSPVGYKIPPCVAFSSLNMNKDGFKWSTKGYSNTSNNDFWHAFGLLTNKGGSLSYDGTNGYYWSASPYNNYSGYRLVFADGRVSSLNTYSRASGCSVRPVSE